MGYSREYYKKHKKKIIARTKKWQEEAKKRDPEAFRESANRRLRKYQSSPKGIYRTLVWHARNKGIGLEIGREEFIEWYIGQEKQCVYCGIPETKLDLLKHKKGRNRLTIDRMDNELPYREDNLALACFTCNFIKLDIFGFEEMKELARLFIRKKWEDADFVFDYDI